MLSGMTSRQLSEWREYYELDPFGEERGDFRSAIVASLIANVFGKRSYKPRDFMPEFGPRRRKTVQEMAYMFATFAQAHNSRLKNRG